MSCSYPLHSLDGYAIVYQFCAEVTNYGVALHPVVDNDAVARQNLLEHIREGEVPPYQNQRPEVEDHPEHPLHAGYDDDDDKDN